MKTCPAFAACASRFHLLMGAALVALLVLMGVAAVWHPLHEELHEDAGHEDHECGITLLAVGHVSADAPACVDAPPAPVAWVTLSVPPCAVRVEGWFTRLWVLEHAPPRPA